jgi:hypothetical protein
MPSYCIVRSEPYVEYQKEYNACVYQGRIHPLADHSKWLLNSLGKKVNDLMQEGWICTGGIQIVSAEGTICDAFQAMVKND